MNNDGSLRVTKIGTFILVHLTYISVSYIINGNNVLKIIGKSGIYSRSITIRKLIAR